MRGSQLDTVLDLLDGHLTGDVLKDGEGEGEGLSHARRGDDVAVDHHGALTGVAPLGEARLEAREARGAMPLEDTELGQDEGAAQMAATCLVAANSRTRSQTRSSARRLVAPGMPPGSTR